jgi:K+/H+ antiporter YhaU regulatory subunit KhtT
VGRTIGEIGFRARLGVNVIAIRRKTPDVTESGESVFKEDLNDMPGPGDRVEEGDTLVLIGPQERIEALRGGT